ncbi:MAG: hypothetical protein HDT06_00265 [Bacteroidales bacterium]|nr:hypothetical protein [Bacteroidales bacterium]
MKKFLYSLLLMIPAIGLLSSCSDDDKNLPDVSFSYEYEGAQQSDGKLYVAQGETFAITAINVKNNEAGKAAGITAADYYWDGRLQGTSVMPPFGFEFVTNEYTPVGEHQIGVVCPVYALDKELANASIFINVVVVASPEDLPFPPTEDDGDNSENPDEGANPEVAVGSTITSGTNQAS